MSVKLLPVRIVITEHAQGRIEIDERLRGRFDLADFSPKHLWSHGRRMWRRADGDAVLIVETRTDTGWTLHVVTALTSAMVDERWHSYDWRPDPAPVLHQDAEGQWWAGPTAVDRWQAITEPNRHAIAARLGALLRDNPGERIRAYAVPAGVDPELAGYVLATEGAVRSNNGRWFPNLRGLATG